MLSIEDMFGEAFRELTNEIRSFYTLAVGGGNVIDFTNGRYAFLKLYDLKVKFGSRSEFEGEDFRYEIGYRNMAESIIPVVIRLIQQEVKWRTENENKMFFQDIDDEGNAVTSTANIMENPAFKSERYRNDIYMAGFMIRKLNSLITIFKQAWEAAGI